MRKSVYQFVLASMVTLADLAVFIRCMPILCEVWGANRPFMAAAMYIWAGSLANLWKIASRSRPRMPGNRPFATGGCGATRESP